MTIIHTHRGRFVQYGTTVFWNILIAEKQILAVIQIGQITLGLDLFMFTKSGDLLLTLDSAYTHVYGYRMTWSQYVGAEQVVLIGDFTFLERMQAS